MKINFGNLLNCKKQEHDVGLDIDLVESSINQLNAEIGQKIKESTDKERIKTLKEVKALTRSLMPRILHKHLIDRNYEGR